MIVMERGTWSGLPAEQSARPARDVAGLVGLRGIEYVLRFGEFTMSPRRKAPQVFPLGRNVSEILWQNIHRISKR
jgi:hypothetical protein